MKFSDVKDLTLTELKAKKKEIQKDIFESAMKNKLGQLSNPLIIRSMRRDIARLATAINFKSGGR